MISSYGVLAAYLNRYVRLNRHPRSRRALVRQPSRSWRVLRVNVLRRVEMFFHWQNQFFASGNRQEREAELRLRSWFTSIFDVSPTQSITRILCFVFFFLPLAFYVLQGMDQLLNRPQALDVGVVAVAAALGGLVLNAGLNLKSPKREKVILVSQEFIAVVILMLLFVPSLYYVELMNGIDTNAFEPDSLEAWVRAFFFWTAVASFFGGIMLFIIALVDLAFAMGGIGDKEYASRNCSCEGCSNSDAS